MKNLLKSVIADLKADAGRQTEVLSYIDLPEGMRLVLDADPRSPMRKACSQMKAADGDTIHPHYQMNGAQEEFGFSLVALEDEVPVGQISIDLDGGVHLQAVFVDANHRRQGLASSLCAGAAELIRAIGEDGIEKKPDFLDLIDIGTVWADVNDMSEQIPGILLSELEIRWESLEDTLNPTP